MSAPAQARVARGVPTGGEYAATVHGEPGISLAAPTVGLEYLEGRLRSAALWDQLTPEMAEEVRARVNGGLSFTDEAITAAANEVHTEVHGYSAAHARDALNAAMKLELGGDNEAGAAIRAVLGATKPAQPVSLERLEDPGAHPDRVDSTDPRVQSGQVFDTVVVDGTEYQRRREGVYPDTPYGMRIQADRPLSDEEVTHFAQILGYAYAAKVHGEPLGWPERDSPYSFTVPADTTKSSSDDLGIALEDFEETLPDLLVEGSQVRKTDRSGPGTKGTRLVDGFGAHAPGFELYYDDVVAG